MQSRAAEARSRAGRPTAAAAAELMERLRRAAVEAFLEHGYEGTTMETVAQAAGITKTTLYSRYPDKRTLFIAVSAWALGRLECAEQDPEPLPDDLAEALGVIARAILAWAVDPDNARLNRMAIAEASRFPEFAASSQAATCTPRIRLIGELLRRHERAGTIVVEDVELAAEQFFAMVGAMPAWLAAYGVHRAPEADEAHLRQAVALFLSGILVRV
jgi:AcrR family transcriptional regulator